MATAVEAAVKGERILWCAPTFGQCRIGWEEMYHAAGGVADFAIARMECTFPTGGMVMFRSMDNPDNARGITADGIVVDEAPLVRASAWQEVLRPIISDTGGWALLMGTPKGRNYFWREWHAAREAPDSEAWAAPTLGVAIEDGQLVRRPHPLENPDFPFTEAVRLWETLPERIFRQEFLAEFIEDTGGVFRNILACATAVPQEEPSPGHEYVIGVDWGKHLDFTVFSVLDATTRTQVYLDRFHQIDYTLQTRRLKVLCDRFAPHLVVVERNSMGEPLIEQLQRDGLPVQPFTTTSASKAQIIDALSLAFERGDITILDDPDQLVELQAYEMTRLPGGMMRYGAPEGMHDDRVMALALAWHGVGMHVGPLIGFA